MELAKYDLSPQQQLAVALYLKSMNKTQAATDAGYASPHVFSNPTVKAAIADQLTIRAERLRVGGDWVLSELRRVYERCMEARLDTVVLSDGVPAGVYKFDSRGALKALELVGRHVDVKAFDPKQVASVTEEEIRDRLVAGRQRAALASPVI